MIPTKRRPATIDMRTLILALAFVAITSVIAQETSASEQLKEKFLGILKQQVTTMMNEAASQSVPPPKPEEVSRQIEAIMTEVKTNYSPVLTLPKDEADRLLTIGPDDKANMTAIRHDIELWKKVQRPMPVLYKRMQDEVTADKIKNGLELELTRRISEFHLHQLGML